ncbi:MAG: Spy/CpxP family protein refolding chaperone [Myxococcales bacterium]|jgi:hypothetical protein
MTIRAMRLPSTSFWLSIVAVASAMVVAPSVSAAPTKVVHAAPHKEPVGPIEHALRSIVVRADQHAAVDAVRKETRAAYVAAKNARKAFLSAVASQAARGKVDRRLLKPEIETVVGTSAALRGAEGHALDRLHAVLDTKQRVTFAQALESAEDVGPVDELPRLARDLRLTADQKKALLAFFHRREGEVRANLVRAKDAAHRLSETFKAKDFQRKGTDAAREVAERSIGRLMATTHALLQVLSPGQRAALAARLHARAVKGAPVGF